ncbi:hypothetical protein Fmac_011087 [Flemingia macrophylla]|uniref:Uncharacterized protein n=1 Tax=Flemingia macrophylla TaxID=520843 RepID=A0ABD1MLF4_9FABA
MDNGKKIEGENAKSQKKEGDSRLWRSALVWALSSRATGNGAFNAVSGAQRWGSKESAAQRQVERPAPGPLPPWLGELSRRLKDISKGNSTALVLQSSEGLGQSEGAVDRRGTSSACRWSKESVIISVKGIKGRLNRLPSACVGDTVVATGEKKGFAITATIGKECADIICGQGLQLQPTRSFQ